MAETVDSLSIELTASTESAETSIDKLIGMLNRLKGAVARASNFSRFAKGIAEIAEAAKGLDTEAGRKLARLAGGLDALSKVGSLDNLKGAGKNLASVMKAVSGETGGKGLSGLADGIKQTNDALGSIKDSDVSRLGAIRDTLAGEVSGPLHTSNIGEESAALGGAATVPAQILPEMPSDFGDISSEVAGILNEITESSNGVSQSTFDMKRSIEETSWKLFDLSAKAKEARTSLNEVEQAMKNAPATPINAGDTNGKEPNLHDRLVALQEETLNTNSFLNGTRDIASGSEEAAGSVNHLRDALGSIGGYIANDVTTVFGNIGNAIKNFASSVLRIARYRMIRSMIRTITEGFSEGKKNLYEWSQAMDGHFAASMDRLATSTQYLKNSLGTLVGPLMEALEPALNWIIDALVTVINYFNMFVAAISGKSTYTAAVRAATTWGGAVSNAAGNASNAVNNAVDDMKRTIMGFDEINKLNDVADSAGGGSGSGGSGGGSGGGVGGMFEERPLSGGFQDFGNALETALQDSLSRITLIVGAAELAVGAILALSGANVPLGLALIATGAVTMGSAIFANWDGIPDEIKLVVGAIEAALGGGLAVGAVLAFSTGHIGLGIGLMVAALSTEFSAVTVVWTTLKDKIGGQIQAIGVLLGSATFGIGAVLAFAGHPTIGIPMMIAGASVAAVAVNWNYLTDALKGPIGDVVALISGALLMLGVAAIAASNVPLGVGLLVAGATGLAATLAVNWNNLGSLMEGPIGKATLAISGALLVLGFAAVSAAQVPLGIGLMVAGAAGLATSLATNWDRLKGYIQGPIGTLVGLISGALLVLGFTAIAASNIPLGVGLMVAGAAGLATSITPVWTMLQDKLKGPIGAVTALVSGASLALGILAIIAANIPLGLGLILAGTAGLVSTVAANWDGLVTIGKTAIAKVQEGWETVKELVVNAVVSLVKKVGEWAEDVWDFLQNTGATIAKKVTAAFEAAKSFAGDVWDSVKLGAETIAKKVTAAFEAAKSFAGDVWDSVKLGAETIAKKVTAGFEAAKSFTGDVWEAVKGKTEEFVKTVKAVFTEVGTWAGNVWNAVKAGAETIVKEVKAIFSEVGSWAGNVWNAVKAGAETIVKTVNAIFSEVGTWAGNVWDAVKTGAETIVKTVNAIFSEVGTWAGNVWNAVKSGAETIVKTVNAIFSEVGTWAGNVWDTVKAGTETIIKTVEAGMKTAASWVQGIVDFFVGPESADKKANIALALENTALAIVNFLRDPAQAIKNVILSLGLKFAQGVEKFWNWITGQDGQSEVQFDAYGNMMIVPKAGDGLTDNGNGQFSLTNDVAGTTVLSPTKSDNWQQEWDELVGGEIPIPVTPTNSLGNKITSPLQWLFGSNTTPEVNTKVNGTAGTGFSGISGNKFSLSGINAGSVTVNGTPGTGFAGKLSGTNKYTLAGIEDSNAKINGTLNPTNTANDAFKTGTALGFNANMSVNKGNDAKTKFATGTALNFIANLTGTGSNWKEKGGFTKWFGGGNNPGANFIANLTGKGSNWKKQGGSAKWIISETDGAVDFIANLTQQRGKEKSNFYGIGSAGWILKQTDKAVSFIANLTSERGEDKSNYKKKGGAAKWILDDTDDSVSFLANLEKNWNGSATSALGLDNLSTKIKVNLEKGEHDTVIIKPSNSQGEIKMVVKRLGGVFSNGIWKSISQFADGGIFSNGIWKDIPQYAGGTTNAHGSMFLAGEAGPELVGHVGGRTEVLNQSQLAATMFSAVRAAMGGVKIAATMYDGGSENGEDDYETMYRAMYDAFTDAMAGSNERDREKVALMRQIAAKEFTAEVTAASVNRAQTRMNRRAGTTIVPVGT